MDFKDTNFRGWLLLAIALLAIGVTYLGVVQLTRFNDSFHYKEFGSQSSYPAAEPSVVPLSRDRFAVVDSNTVTVYSVDAQGQITVKDGVNVDMDGRSQQVRHLPTVIATPFPTPTPYPTKPLAQAASPTTARGNSGF